MREVTRPVGPVELASPGDAQTLRCGESITVLSANLWHDWPRRQRWPERLEAFARLVESVEADILLLQEVARAPGLAADRWLAGRLGMSAAYLRANGSVDAISFEEGPAILSRFPLERPGWRQLSHGVNPLVRRVAIGAHSATPLGGLYVVSAHLGLVQRHQAGQVRRLREWVTASALETTSVIGGDFNATEFRPEMTQLGREWTDAFRQSHPESPSTTHTRLRTLRRPLHRRLDYVFVQQSTRRAWRVLESRHVVSSGEAHSDHQAVLARLAPDDDNSLHTKRRERWAAHGERPG
jgi:endonuclease/exonuclease/phosphatase family metal-dependent hydrolase